MNRPEQIATNLRNVRSRIDRAVQYTHRAAGSVRLLAVSKTVSPEDIVSALGAGQVEFAENYGQEFRDKSTEVARLSAHQPGMTGPRWHFIGPLQTNKVKYVAGKVALVHSVGSPEVLAELQRRSAGMGVIQHCLVQVNVAGEAQKSGVLPAHLPVLLERFASCENLRCTGLMVIPPYDENPESSRPHFQALRQLRDTHRSDVAENVTLVDLSMGMSHDLEVAISEGATIVRVGTAIFGTRT